MIKKMDTLIAMLMTSATLLQRLNRKLMNKDTNLSYSLSYINLKMTNFCSSFYDKLRNGEIKRNGGRSKKKLMIFSAERHSLVQTSILNKTGLQRNSRGVAVGALY